MSLNGALENEDPWPRLYCYDRQFRRVFFETSTRPFGHHGHVCVENRTKRHPRELRVSAALTAFQFLGLHKETLTDNALYVSETFADG